MTTESGAIQNDWKNAVSISGLALEEKGVAAVAAVMKQFLDSACEKSLKGADLDETVDGLLVAWNEATTDANR